MVRIGVHVAVYLRRKRYKGERVRSRETSTTITVCTSQECLRRKTPIAGAEFRSYYSFILRRPRKKAKKSVEKPERRRVNKCTNASTFTYTNQRLDFLKTTNPCREWALEKFRFAEQTDSREAFDTSVNPAEGNDRINGGTAASAASCADPSVVISRSCEEVDEAATAAAPPAAQKTVAERLEVVKAEEAELLRQFEQVHKRCAKVNPFYSSFLEICVYVCVARLPSTTIPPVEEVCRCFVCVVVCLPSSHVCLKNNNCV